MGNLSPCQSVALEQTLGTFSACKCMLFLNARGGKTVQSWLSAEISQ